MAVIIRSEEILDLVQNIDLVQAMKKGFIQYSNGNTVVPPVGELLFEKPEGEAHIKSGYIEGDEFYVIKIASGFYDNQKLGISSSQGLMLLFSQKTGEPKAILLDDGKLTDLRTAAAGALAAKYFAPTSVKAIGIIGTGIQARLQLELLLQVIPCTKIWVWGRNREKADQFQKEYASEWDVQVADSPAHVAQKCNLIVTATPSRKPLLHFDDIAPGTHITAVGSDTAEKQELDSKILGMADIVIADSISQSKSRGEIFRATQKGDLSDQDVIELGVALQDKTLQRTNNQQITITDLTGVAVQDIMIANAVYRNYITKK